MKKLFFTAALFISIAVFAEEQLTTPSFPDYLKVIECKNDVRKENIVCYVLHSNAMAQPFYAVYNKASKTVVYYSLQNYMSHSNDVDMVSASFEKSKILIDMTPVGQAEISLSTDNQSYSIRFALNNRLIQSEGWTYLPLDLIFSTNSL